MACYNHQSKRPVLCALPKHQLARYSIPFNVINNKQLADVPILVEIPSFTPTPKNCTMTSFS